MRGLFALAFLSVFTGSSSYAQDSQIVDVLACKLREGKTLHDVMALADSWRKAWPALNDKDPSVGAFVWTSFREGSPYDYVLGYINTDQKSFAAGVAGYYASGLGAGLDAQVDATGVCDAAIVFSEQIRDGGGVPDRPGDQPDAVVETFSCKINQGFSIADVEAAEEFWRRQLTELGSSALSHYETFRWTPYRGGSGKADFVWVGNSADLASWAQGEMDYLGSKQGQAAEARFAKVSTCVSGMWLGYWIVAPTAGPTSE